MTTEKRDTKAIIFNGMVLETYRHVTRYHTFLGIKRKVHESFQNVEYKSAVLKTTPIGLHKIQPHEEDQ